MKSCFLQCCVAVIILTAMVANAAADDAKDEAIKKDRQRIEGTWRIVELVINGNPAKDEDLP